MDSFYAWLRKIKLLNHKQSTMPHWVTELPSCPCTRERPFPLEDGLDAHQKFLATRWVAKKKKGPDGRVFYVHRECGKKLEL